MTLSEKRTLSVQAVTGLSTGVDQLPISDRTTRDGVGEYTCALCLSRLDNIRAARLAVAAPL